MQDLSGFQHPRFARMYERLSAEAERNGMAELRIRLLSGLGGRVVEVGAGNGMNFPHYPPQVREVVAVEPEDRLRALGERAAAPAPVPITVVRGHAGALPYDAESFDAAVVSLVLCSVPDQAAVLAEVRRVLKPGGELRFFEHVRSANPVRGVVQDLITPLRKGGAFRVLTPKDPKALDVLRHSGAHILATAVRRLRPDAKIGFGPAIEDGFYYDFEVEKPFTPEDLEQFESEMRKVIAEKYPFIRAEVDQGEAREKFADDPLKLERLSEFSEDEIISTYTDGPFIDLCRGPHVPDTSYLKHFKLLHTAGAYWRGDEKRQMLQRIYATAFFSKEDLEAYLHRLEEAKRRDHRVLGALLDLYSTDQRLGPGLILWHPRGAIIRNEIETYERDLILRHGYDLVYTPHIVSEKLFQISGHLQSFAENMFGAMEVEGAAYRPKPMNCPGHICIYQAHTRSYRDLPIRYAEFGTVYRYERSGVLHGMLRVRGFTQDDAHVFCTAEQVPT